MTDTTTLLEGVQKPRSDASALVRSLHDRKWRCLTPGEQYYSTVIHLCSQPDVSSVMEIGGGRSPLLPREQIRKLDAAYVVNDISASELSRCPDHVEKVCFDISGDAPSGQYDFIFSKMVFEHIRETRRAYENIFQLLRPGGVCLNYHPTLYSPPFVLNGILPVAVSAFLLRVFYRNRNPDETPKFPANYSWCKATKRQEEKIRKIGFAGVSIIPFYGHGYFSKIPILRELDNALSVFARRRGIRSLASYAFTIAHK